MDLLFLPTRWCCVDSEQLNVVDTVSAMHSFQLPMFPPNFVHKLSTFVPSNTILCLIPSNEIQSALELDIMAPLQCVTGPFPRR